MRYLWLIVIFSAISHWFVGFLQHNLFIVSSDCHNYFSFRHILLCYMRCAIIPNFYICAINKACRVSSKFTAFSLPYQLYKYVFDSMDVFSLTINYKYKVFNNVCSFNRYISIFNNIKFKVRFFLFGTHALINHLTLRNMAYTDTKVWP